MLSGRHSKCSNPFTLAWLNLPPSLLVVAILFLHLASAQEFSDLSIPLTSSQIVYTPFVCNATTVLDKPQSCAGAWQLSDSDVPSISTRGPSSSSSNLIPQMFFQFQAFSIFLTTLPSSNATINVTISANGVVVSSDFHSSLGALSIINLPGNMTSLLTLTFIKSSSPTQFDLDSLTITTLSNATISSFLPTPTLPPSISFPTFAVSTKIPPPLTSASSLAPVRASNKTMVAEAVGITVGLGLGLTAFAAVGFWYWNVKRRKERLKRTTMEETSSGWRSDGFRYR
ncbi:hypothetical protein M413DRAFT_447121 [Hebeloma cylindrosporum]|uniref:Mid2 domain-containing protein n=1 Tax=Hebeloma cylindrosporum TaxID=76867 RepID=A0A0C2YF58_HEBCY|nr:hypothetical protein M413DRAFT_447121 [Hebeloma cylindrosporum h7]